MPGIRSEKAAELVAGYIEQLVLEGAIRPGDPLPPERELAEKLGVSRPTLRDGLKMLASKGLLENIDGRGTRIAALGAQSISDPLLSLLAHRPEISDNYLEFRDVVESSAAAMAAERATDADLERIRNCIEEIDVAHLRALPEQEADADAELHMAVYEASHNLVLLQIMRALSANLKMDVVHNRAQLFALPSVRDLLREQHHKIGRAILERNADAAWSAAHEHLAYLRRAVREIKDSQAKLDLSLRRMEWRTGRPSR